MVRQWWSLPFQQTGHPSLHSLRVMSSDPLCGFQWNFSLAFHLCIIIATVFAIWYVYFFPFFFNSLSNYTVAHLNEIHSTNWPGMLKVQLELLEDIFFRILVSTFNSERFIKGISVVLIVLPNIVCTMISFFSSVHFSTGITREVMKCQLNTNLDTQCLESLELYLYF